MRTLVIGLAVFALAAPATARADEEIRAATVWRFEALTYTIDQGEPLSFLNVDAASPGPHNVTASDAGADGKPLFASKTVAHGEGSPVEGARQLKTGSYDFICTVHPFMQATLMVTASGTPAPPPGQPAPSPAPQPAPSQPPADAQAPRLKAAIAAGSLRTLTRTRRLKVTVISDERAALKLRLTARIGSRTVSVATAAGDSAAAGDTATFVLKPSKAALKALRGRRTANLTLAVEARDGAGNVGTTLARRTLRR
jgi:plastocyanin